MTIECVRADLTNKLHTDAIIELLDFKARDECGGGTPLSDYAKTNLIKELSCRPSSSSFLASVDNVFVGISICLEAFSTFACKPILNIHDFAILPSYRRKGISKILFAKIEEYAKEIGCCKMTLEVLENNIPAKSAYESFGFQPYQLDPKLGGALYYQKYVI
eukprot:gene8958-18542_t